jgi:tetratricopeptide (TPR) repeat protein
MTEPVIRLFISSPSDVSTERRRAALVVERLNGEFAGRVCIEPILWEEHFYSSHAGFQDQIAEAARCDIVIAVFGGRLGTRLPDNFPLNPATGQPYPSGTAYEVLSAIAARKAGQDLPDIYVFRFPQSPAVRVDDPDRAEVETQWNALKSFFDTWFRRQGGAFIAAFHEYSSTDNFSAQVEKCLREFLARRGFVTPGPVWDRLVRGSPFPGLSAFEADRRAVFFGRDRAIAQALDRLRQAGSQAGRLPFLLVIGASGSGKSSLLRAGLMPRLTTPGTIPDVDLWRGVVITPGQDPFLSLAEALFADAALGIELRAGAFTDAAMLARQLAADPDLAVAPVRAALAVAAAQRMSQAKFDTVRPARLALAVDQAERLFTETDPEVALRLATLLARLVAGGVAYVILTLRSDAYGRFQSLPPLLALREAGASFDLVPPGADELQEIITRPVQACDPELQFEPGLAARLAADAEGGDALPLLQLALAQLYDAQAARDDGVLRDADYLGMGEAVTSTAQAASQGLPQQAVDALPALVAAMVSDVTIDPVTGLPIATIVPLDRAQFTRDNPARDQLLDAFIASRLLTADGNAAHIAVRPTHEALLRIWPRAVELVTELGPTLRVRRALAPLVRDWQAAAETDKPRHLEISPALLEGALQLPARLDVDPAMTAFIDACAAEAEIELRRRHEQEARDRRLYDAESLAAVRRRTALATAVGLVVALLLAAFAGEEWREAVVQSKRAEQALALATDAANGLVFDLAQKLHDTPGVPVAAVSSILAHAGQLQASLLGLGSPSAALRRGQAIGFNEMSTTLLAEGQTEAALDAAKQAQGIFQSLADEQPTNADWQQGLSVSFGKVGEVQVARGNLPEALKSYQAGLAIAERLAKLDPDNAEWQRGLSVSFENVGDVQVAQGNLADALISYRASLAIRERLAKSDPGVAGWQRDISVSLDKVGTVQAAQGDLPAALESYQTSLAIANRLASADPGNAGWQRNLSMSSEKTGDVLVAQGNLAEALKSYQAGLAIADRLAKTDPGNAGWQADLSVSFDKIGDVQAAQGNLPEALESYQAGLAIADRLASADPGNAGWQRDLSVSFEKVGNVQAAQGNLPEALKSYQAGLAIRDRLAKSDPSNASWQRELAVSYAKLGTLLVRQQHPADARVALTAGRQIIAQLLARLPDRAQWKQDLAWFDRNLASLPP